ncbi:RNA 2',3'-cyclic phosphodiesterase [Sphingomonas aurantiaca]|uniref:RNA 2',3'-cyclic phosphodiesterase n=1 Tax=Sphingomonas aurantiaca TaxID=185949 RepID=UPI002FE2DA96
MLDIMEGVPAARWQDDKQLHITLRFIGAVERPIAEDVAVALSHVVAPAPVVALAGVGRFEKRGRTDTLWVGVTPHDALASLHRKVDQACVRAGLEPERRAYLPHLTVARLARSAGVGFAVDPWLAVHAGLASAPFPLPHLVLYQAISGAMARPTNPSRDGRSIRRGEPEPRRRVRKKDQQGETICGLRHWH